MKFQCQTYLPHYHAYHKMRRYKKKVVGFVGINRSTLQFIQYFHKQASYIYFSCNYTCIFQSGSSLHKITHRCKLLEYPLKITWKKLGNKIFTAKFYLFERYFVITIPVKVHSAKLKISGIIYDRINILITYTQQFWGSNSDFLIMTKIFLFNFVISVKSTCLKGRSQPTISSRKAAGQNKCIAMLL